MQVKWIEFIIVGLVIVTMTQCGGKEDKNADKNAPADLTYYTLEEEVLKKKDNNAQNIEVELPHMEKVATVSALTNKPVESTKTMPVDTENAQPIPSESRVKTPNPDSPIELKNLNQKPVTTPDLDPEASLQSGRLTTKRPVTTINAVKKTTPEVAVPRAQEEVYDTVYMTEEGGSVTENVRQPKNAKLPVESKRLKTTQSIPVEPDYPDVEKTTIVAEASKKPEAKSAGLRDSYIKIGNDRSGQAASPRQYIKLSFVVFSANKAANTVEFQVYAVPVKSRLRMIGYYLVGIFKEIELVRGQAQITFYWRGENVYNRFLPSTKYNIYLYYKVKNSKGEIIYKGGRYWGNSRNYFVKLY